MPRVYVEGHQYWGLGNILFQVASALYYHVTHHYEIVLNQDCPYIQYGNKDPRHAKNYREDIFARFSFDALPPPERRITLTNDYQCHRYDEVTLDPQLCDLDICIQGYCQHHRLFDDIRPALNEWFPWNDPVILRYLDAKYAHVDWTLPTVLVGLRIRDDFKHMTKIQPHSYQRALHHMAVDFAGGYNIMIVSDTSVGIDAALDFPLPGCPAAVEYVEETDIVQMYLGLRCSHFVLCESTFHYWIAVFRQIRDPDRTRVVCFEDTDMTLRNLALPEWERIPYHA